MGETETNTRPLYDAELETIREILVALDGVKVVLEKIQDEEEYQRAYKYVNSKQQIELPWKNPYQLKKTKAN